MGAGTSVAKITIDTDGVVTPYTSLRDTGSGFYTVLRQIVGQELGVPYTAVRLNLEYRRHAFDTGVGGSRVTNVGAMPPTVRPGPSMTSW